MANLFHCKNQEIVEKEQEFVFFFFFIFLFSFSFVLWFSQGKTALWCQRFLLFLEVMCSVQHVEGNCHLFSLERVKIMEVGIKIVPFFFFFISWFCVIEREDLVWMCRVICICFWVPKLGHFHWVPCGQNNAQGRGEGSSGGSKSLDFFYMNMWCLSEWSRECFHVLATGSRGDD